jgi:hypothetical protein
VANQHSILKTKIQNSLHHQQLMQMAKMSIANIASITVTLILYTGTINRVGLEGFAYINVLVTGLAFSAGLAGFGLPEYLQKLAGTNSSNAVEVALGGLFSVTPIIALIAYTHNIVDRRIDAIEACAILIAIPSILVNESGFRVLLQIGKTEIASIVNLVPNILFWIILNLCPKQTALSNVVVIYSLVNGCFSIFLIRLIKTKIPNLKFSWLLFHGGSISQSAYGLRLIVTGFDLLPLLMLQIAKVGCLAGLYSFLGRFFFPMILLLNISSAVLQKSNFTNGKSGSSVLRRIIINFSIFIGILLAVTATAAFMVFGDEIIRNDKCIRGDIKVQDLFGLMVYKVAYICCKFLLESNLNNLLVSRIRIAVLVSLMIWFLIIWLCQLGASEFISASIWVMGLSVILVNTIIVARNRTK